MLEKTTLIVLGLLAVGYSGKVPAAETEAKDADFGGTRSPTLLPLPSSHNDHRFAKIHRSPVLLSAPLSRTPGHGQPEEAGRKAKRCSARFRKSRLPFFLGKKKDPVKKGAGRSDVNVHAKASTDVPYALSRSAKYSTKNSVAKSWVEWEAQEYDKPLLRVFRDQPKDEDSREEMKRCGDFVCYCKEENCVRKSCRANLPRMLESSRRMKPERVYHRRPTGYENGRAILGASVPYSGTPRWYQAVHREPPILGLINPVPMRPIPQDLRNPAVFAPLLLHGVPLLSPEIVGKDGNVVNPVFLYALLKRKPNFIVGDQVQYQRRPIGHHDPQEWRYLSERKRFNTSTVSTTSAWTSNADAILNLKKEESSDFSHKTITMNYPSEPINPVAESNVELGDTIGTNEISEAEILPKLSATLSTSSVQSVTEAGTNGNFGSHSSSGTIGSSLANRGFPGFTAAPEISYAKTDSEARSGLNQYYFQATTTSATKHQSESSTSHFGVATLSWTVRPDLDSEGNHDRRTEHTRPPPTELDDGATEGTYEANNDYNTWYSDESGSSNNLEDERVSMNKLTEGTIGELEEGTKAELLGKSKSHTTKMLMGPSRNWESTTMSSLEDDGFLSATISYDSNENDFTTKSPVVEEPRRGYEEKTTTPCYGSSTLIESISEAYPWRGTLQDRPTTTKYSNRGETNDDGKENPEYTTEGLVGVTDSSAKRLSFCDDALLLSTIRRVINNFASSDDLAKTRDLDEQGEILLPEIRRISNLKSVLSTPRVEDAIVKKVADILFNIKGKMNFDWSSDIRHSLRNLSEGFHGPRHEKKLPAGTVEEHQFDAGRWRTKLVTLAPPREKKPGELSMAPENLREGIRDLLGYPAIASQADQPVVQNIILQSLRSSLANEDDGLELEDSVILDALRDALRTKEDDTSPKLGHVNAEEDANVPRGTSARDENESGFKTKGNVGGPLSSGAKQLAKDTSVDGTAAWPTSYQKAEKLDGDRRVLAAPEAPDPTKSGKLCERKKATAIPPTDAEASHAGTENVPNPVSTTDEIKVQAEVADESWERTSTRQEPAETYNLWKAPGRASENLYAMDETPQDGALVKMEHVGGGLKDPEKLPGTTISIDNIEAAVTSIRPVPRKNTPPGRLNEENHVVPGVEAAAVQFSEANAQETTTESSSCTFLKKSEEFSSWNEGTGFDERRISGADLKESKERDAETSDAMKTTEDFSTYDEMDPTMLRATSDVDTPINYYSPNDRILDYMKSHRIDNEDETTMATASFMRKLSSDYAPSDNVASNGGEAAAANSKHEIKQASDEKGFSLSGDTTNDSISSARSCANREMEANVSSSSGLLQSQQDFPTGDVIKIHEVTTEVQKTHAKTVYFQPRTFDAKDASRTDSSTTAYEATNIGSDNDNLWNRSNDPSDATIDEASNVAAAVPTSGETSDSLPSMSVSEESIAQLQKSKLYYVNDGVKLPLEIRRLKDGTYALSIAKDVCEQIVRRKCCVPLQGHVVVQSLRSDEDYQPVAPSSTTTLRSTLEKLEEKLEKELNVHRLPNDRRKRDSVENDSTRIVSMPVLDFVRKYNLSLDFHGKKATLNKPKSNEKTRNSSKPFIRESERNRLGEQNLDDYFGREWDKDALKNEKEDEVGEPRRSMNTRNRDILGVNVEDLRKTRLQKSQAKMNRSGRAKTQRKLEAEDDDQRSMNVMQIMNFDNRDIIPERTNIFEEKTSFKSNEIKLGDFEVLVKNRGEMPEEIKLIKLGKDKKDEQRVNSNKEDRFNISKIKVIENKSGRPYRYQRNTNSGSNKGTEIVRNILHWFKGLFTPVNRNK